MAASSRTAAQPLVRRFTAWARRVGSAFGLAVALAGVFASAFPLVAGLEEHYGLQWLFALRGTREPPPEVLVVALDQASASALQLPPHPRQWPRDLHTRLIEGLSAAGAKAIVFDLSFDLPGAAPDADLALAEAMRRAGNVVLVGMLRKDVVQLAGEGAGAAPVLSVETLAPALPALRDAAAAYAPFILPKEARVNAYWTFDSTGTLIPSLPSVAFQLHALTVLDELFELMGQAGGTAIVAAGSAGELVAARRMSAAMSELRSAMLAQPAASRALLRRIEAPGDEETLERRRLLRSAIDLYASDEMRYLNFYGPARTIPTLSYHEALRTLEADPPDHAPFRGKTVFVGFSPDRAGEQDRIRDDYHTVYSRPDGMRLSGVEIAATAFANLREALPVRPLTFPWNLALIAAWGLVAAFVCRTLRPTQAVPALMVLVAAYLAVAARQFGATGLWPPLVVSLCLQTPLALVGGLWLQFRDERREKASLRRAFGFFLPDAVVDQLTRSRSFAEVNRVIHGACMATDAVRYTTLAEQLAPDRVGARLNDYFATVFAPVERHGGLVCDVVGDAMLAVWVSADDRVASRRAACLAALEIAAPSPEGGRDGSPALATRIGLDAGEMMLGTVGAGRHYEYRAVGDVVNTASRIEQLGKLLGCRLLVAEAVLEGLDEFLTRPLGRFLLRGKARPVVIHELVGLRERAGEGEIARCADFARAMEDCRARRWASARDRFRRLLDADPDDGPSRFYLQRCEARLVDPEVDSSNDIVVV